MSDTRNYGIICSGISDVVAGYAAALNTKHIFDVTRLIHWKQFMPWFRNDRHFSKYITLALVFTDKAGPFLYEAHRRYSPVLVAVPYSQWSICYDYDLVLEPWELGWGVEKKRFADIAANRGMSSKPVFHMLSRDEQIESRLGELGYVVHYGNAYYLSDVALEPSVVRVPTLMYEAAASGMPVISVRENYGWTRRLGVYDGIFLNGGVDSMVKEVEDSDFLYAGMMAMDMVPSLGDFKREITTLLNGFEKQLSIDNSAA